MQRTDVSVIGLKSFVSYSRVKIQNHPMFQCRFSRKTSLLQVTWLQLSLCPIKDWTHNHLPIPLLFLLPCNRIMADYLIAPHPFIFFFALSSWFKIYSTMWIAQFLIHAASVNGFLVFARFQATRIHLYGCVFVKNSNRLSCKLPPIVLPSVCGSQNVLDNCSQNCCAMYWNGISC